MCHTRTLLVVFCSFLLSLLLSGCGLIQVLTPTAPTASPTQALPTGTPIQDKDVPKSGPISRLEDVQKAVVRIDAQGSFIDPEFGEQTNVAGQGSGFIIDSSGLAITNNHVATGAAFLKVWLAGEDRPRSARVVGASECSDLALIQIDGKDFPYLEWYEGKIIPGLEVYAAGYPLGEEYTLTRGIVSKERADGNTNWTSVDYVIEHDATINPGSSGGPLVTGDGKVVGVNFAIDTETEQSYAISRAEVDRILAQLAAGQDVTSIGINGQIVWDEEISGLWVASVKSGSPADKTGIKAGDVILEMEGITLGSDGTMGDYCSILRSHLPTDVLTIRILRPDTDEILEGQINGRELQVVQVKATPSASGGYVTIQHDDGVLEMDVPAAWEDIHSDYWVRESDGKTIGPRLIAAPDADAFADSYEAPGVAFIASRVLVEEHTPDSFLDIYAEEIEDAQVCQTRLGRQSYRDPFYEGVAEAYEGCGTSGNTKIVLVAATPEDESFMVSVWVQYQAEEDLQRILDSFWVSGELEDASTATVSDEEYVTIQHDDGVLEMDVPAAWEDVRSDYWVHESDGKTIGPRLIAAPDADAFADSYEAPGVAFIASRVLVEEYTPDSFLDTYFEEIEDAGVCQGHRRQAYSDPFYEGMIDIYDGCGTSGDTKIVLVAATPEDKSFMVSVWVQYQAEEDLQHILDSFWVSGELP